MLEDFAPNFQKKDQKINSMTKIRMSIKNAECYAEFRSVRKIA